MDKTKDAIEQSISKEDLDKIKHQLFMENVRLQSERSQIAEELEAVGQEKKNLAYERKQLIHEKKQLSIEINGLKQDVEYERKRLKEEEKIIEKKLKIVERSYELLEQDKRNLHDEYARARAEKERYHRMNQTAAKEVYATGLFFRGVNNVIALKKRYKDLMKIYHPDNAAGDSEIILKINEEYDDLKNKYGLASKRA